MSEITLDQLAKWSLEALGAGNDPLFTVAMNAYALGMDAAYREAAADMRDAEEAGFNEGYARALDERGEW